MRHVNWPSVMIIQVSSGGRFFLPWGIWRQKHSLLEGLTGRATRSDARYRDQHPDAVLYWPADLYRDATPDQKVYPRARFQRFLHNTWQPQYHKRLLSQQDHVKWKHRSGQTGLSDQPAIREFVPVPKHQAPRQVHQVTLVILQEMLITEVFLKLT